jgi:hypothetical protein
MQSNLKIVVTLAGCSCFLTACGGSSTGSSSFEAIASEGRSLIAQYGAAPTTDIANMPTTGTATYNGAAAYSTQYSSAVDISQYATTVSDVTLTADFANSTVTGTADNFHTVSTPNVTLDGSLSLNGNIIGDTFATNLNGTVTETITGLTGAQASLNGIQIPVSYTGSTNGEFVGSSAEAFRATGTGTGTATYLGEPLSLTVNAFFGGVQE